MYKNKAIKFWSLVFLFAKRDLRIRYVQTYFGIIWILVQPLLGYLFITFGKLIKVGNDIPNYSIFAFCGMMGWYYFSYVLGFSGISLLQNQDLIQKSNIPKLVLPLSKALSGLFEFIIWLIVLIVIILINGYIPSFKMFFLPFYILVNMLTGLCFGLLICSFTLKYRDIYLIIPYIVGLAFLITPVLYPASLIPENFRFIVYCNPMAGAIEGYRWLFLNTEAPSNLYFFGFGLLVIFFFFALMYFKSLEKKMADII